MPQTRAQIRYFESSTSAHGPIWSDQTRKKVHTAAPGPYGWTTSPPLGTIACEMGLHRQPKGGSGHNPQLCAPAATHMHTWQKSALQTCPCHRAKLPSAPPAPPPDTRPARAPTVARFRALWLGTMTSRSVKPPNRWSSQIDASVTTASGVDLWTRESVSARSRAYARLRWGVRGSIAVGTPTFHAR